MNTSIESMNMVPDEREVHHVFWVCLSLAEATFGTHSLGWQYKVQLRDSPAYPETAIVGPELVCVWLTKERSRVGYLYEAGHEAVHCLNPGPPDATYLEEAVAATFSRWLVSSRFGQLGLEKTMLTKDYCNALQMASAIDTDVVRLGSRLRGHIGSLREVSSAVILELYPRTPDSTVQQILEAFPRQSDVGSAGDIGATRRSCSPTRMSAMPQGIEKS